MKIKYSAVAEMQEAPKHIKNQLQDITQWTRSINRKLDVLYSALDCELLSLEEMPEKIATLRSSLYEIDKSLEILNTNCVSVVQTQIKEENDQSRNGNSDKQVEGAFDK